MVCDEARPPASLPSGPSISCMPARTHGVARLGRRRLQGCWSECSRTAPKTERTVQLARRTVRLRRSRLGATLSASRP